MEATDLKPLLNKLVRYYREGWRCGTLVSLKGATARIRPVASHNSTKHLRCVMIPTADIEGEVL